MVCGEGWWQIRYLRWLIVLVVYPDIYLKSSMLGVVLLGQAQAIRHGIARALQNQDPDFRPRLKKGPVEREHSIWGCFAWFPHKLLYVILPCALNRNGCGLA